MIARRRRWSFSLRTLFVVVTVLAGWLGYYVHWKNERSKARAWLDTRRAISYAFRYTTEPRPAMPWMLGVLGDHPEIDIILIRREPSGVNSEPAPPEYRQLVRRIVGLFPEAQVVDLTPER
jgi:hypothetical protein